MHTLNNVVILIFALSLQRVTSTDVKFNSLKDKLVLKLLRVQPHINTVGSEEMVRFPLCKLASIATGDVKEDLMSLLGYKKDIDVIDCYQKIKLAVQKMRTSDLTYVNKIYLNYTTDIDPHFLINATEDYGIQVDKVGFNYPRTVVSHINKVFNTATYKRLQDIVDANDVNKNMTMLIITGAHFKGTWTFPFDARLTRLQNFFRMDGRITKTPMMTKVDEFRVVTTLDCQAVSIHFGSQRSSFTIVLPNTQKELPNLLEKMEQQPNYVDLLVEKMKFTLLKVTLPRIKIKTYVDWAGFLQELGVYSIFDNKTLGLSGIYKKESRNNTISLSKFKQKLFVQIDEMGAARFMPNPFLERSKPSVPPYVDVPKFVADRPFFFQITLDFEEARYEMFTGVYYGPEPET